MLEIAIQLAFAFLVITAIMTDIHKLQIPNWVPLSLIALFCVHHIGVQPDITLAKSLALMCLTFAVSAALFHIGLLGGGDVKLLTALTLWMGPDQILHFLILFSLIGGVLGFLVMRSSAVCNFYPSFAERNYIISRMTDWRTRGVCPYGVAIGLAALLVGPTSSL